MGFNYEDINGYYQLSDAGKELFKRVHKQHMDNIEDKTDWIVASVQEHRKYIKVTFRNGEWLHYGVDGTWY
jgi:DNA-binding PadR family transcriptional regulator